MCLVNSRYNEPMKAKSSKPGHRGMARSASRPPRKREPLGRQVWLDAAREALIEEGTAGVEVKKLAKRLRSSRGGFYWFFKNRQQLLEELLAYWAKTGTTLFEKILRTPGRNGMEEYLALINLWIDESDYDPKWDGAVRDWARTSESVRKVVANVDQRRIAILEQIFQDMGYRGKEAHIRARITYYHQVGYYALGVQESRKERLELLPFYKRVLTGRDS
jgi:AcrR family transcriptional regulator